MLVGGGVGVGVAVFVGVDVWVGIGVSVAVAVLVGVAVGVDVAVPVDVEVKVGSGPNSRVGLGLASLRVLMNLLTRSVTPSSGVGVGRREAEFRESWPEKALKSRSIVGDAVAVGDKGELMVWVEAISSPRVEPSVSGDDVVTGLY